MLRLLALTPILVIFASACGGGSGAGATPTAVPIVTIAQSPGAGDTQTAVVRPAAALAPLVAIDAGHGGPHNVGAAHANAQGQTDLVEKDLTLDVARRIDSVLKSRGYRTVMIRDGDYALSTYDGTDFTASVRAESQARADAVNATGADLMLVIHFNGSEDATQSGTEVYYNPDRPFGDKNLRLAKSVHDGVIAAIRGIPWDDNDRGVKDDAPIGERFGQKHTFLLGEAPGFRVTTMPAIIVEALFVSNEREAALLRRDDVRDAIARGYADGVDAYFRR